ncbi:hypothetical protein L6164_027329 [Bauhinia variegata]|uniref:Uncharacterized protein n=1 Tax=Bauhinia variegata TaxID=167791 RepID=A0ACB9LSK7_BAUVA|nr:hypothetical protein L6164_027329 [Bauhinia variegata]
MDKVYEELDEAKAEIEKLKAELRGKTDSLENLKKSHNAQVNRIQEAQLKNEKLDQELLQKADELIEAKQMYEDLKGNFNGKESIIKRLTSANDKLRADCDEKFRRLEDERRGLVMALEEANEKVENQEQQIHGYRREIESLKGYLSVSKKKSSEVEKDSKASREMRERDDMFQRLEEENRKLEDQLKWKKEQFKHLEEAHQKLRDQFRSSKKEWESEKSTLLDEISTLETKLDSQIRVSEDLQYQLKMCNQALAHEESRRKRLEVQISEFKVQFDNVSSEYEDARLQLDRLNTQRDNDIGDLRYSLKTKEAYYKELKYKLGKLEEENKELRISLKELQEAHIQEAGASFSQSKLRTKLRNLEQVHRECATTLKAKEAELNFQLENLTRDLNGCQCELENKTAVLEELKKELESSHALAIQLKLLNEEMSVMLLVLKHGISEAQMKFANDGDEMDLIDKEREEKLTELMNQLEMKNAALISAQKDINEEREKAACLMKKVESLNFTLEQQESLQNELDRYKEMLEESTKCQLHLEKKVLQVESTSEEKLKEVSDTLERANTELYERIYEGSEMEFELQIWKSIVERLKSDIEENHAMRKALETSLIAQVDFGVGLKQEKDSLISELEEKERRIDDLQQQVVLLEQELIKERKTEAYISASGEIAVSSETDKLRFLQIIEEKDKILEELQKEVVWLEQESFRREFESAVIAKGSTESAYEREKENLIQLINGKALRTDELIQQAASLEQQFTDSLVSMSSKLAEKQAEINLVREACDKITAAEILAVLEMEEKKLMIVELEDEIRDIRQKLKLQEESWSQSEQLALEIEADMEAKQLKLQELTDQMETKLRNSDALLHKLKMENRKLLENVTKLTLERENLLGFVQGLGDKICQFSTADAQLVDMLRSMVQPSDNDSPGINLKENQKLLSPTGRSKLEASSEIRSPFKELNA